MTSSSAFDGVQLSVSAAVLTGENGEVLGGVETFRDLSEVEALCDQVSIIRAGRVVESGTLAEMRHLTRTQVVADLDSAPMDLAQLPGVHDVVLNGHRLTAQVDASALGAVLGRLAGHGIRSLTSSPPTLEDLFLRHYDEAAG